MNRAFSPASVAALFLAAVMLLSLGFLIGVLTTVPVPSHAPGAHTPMMRLTDFDLTNPLLECEGAEETIGGLTLRPFVSELKELVDKLRTEGPLDQLAVYFRDLNNGPWYGVNDGLEFSSTSLKQLPVALVFLKEAETDPGVLLRTVTNTLRQDRNASRAYRPARTAFPGGTFRIQDLIELMLAGSDDNAATLLAKRMDPRIAAQVARDLGLPGPGDASPDALSLRSYSMIFRALFNASYLSRGMSEKALSWMSRSSFRQGIAAGVPAGMAVASTYGEQTEGLRGEVKELHDCGIIYYPENPYLLCIMTRGPRFEANEAAIRDISRFVFSVVDAHERQQPPAQRR